MRTSRRSSALLVLFALVSTGFAQQTTKGKAAENATVALLQMNKAYLQTPAAQKSAALTQLRTMAAQRQQLLSSLIQTNPADVLRIAIPNNVRGAMPAAVQSYVEQTVQAQGVLEVAIEDSTSGSKMHYGLTTAAGKLALHFTDQPPTNLLTGSVMTATGVQVGGDLALACCSSDSPSSSSTVPASGVLPNTFGNQNVLVILVNFQDNQTQPWTVSSVSSLMFGTAIGTVNGFYQDASYGQTSLTGDVAGWYTIPLSSTNCSTSSIQSYAQKAAQNAGYVLSNYTRFVYAFPSTTACAWSGWSYVGGNPSNSWINGNMSLRVVAHELGHAFGLYHSHSLSCTSGGAQVTLSGSCSTVEYGDELDDMGSPYPMYFNASQKERLGWLNYGASPPITTVTTSGTYSIAPYETYDSSPKALRILQSGSSNSYYYVESRQFIGDDKWVQTNAVLSSVLFHLSSPSNANSSDILQMNPSSTNSYGWENPGLQQGATYTDSAAGLTVTPTSVSSTGATVQVTLAGATCTSANPTISVSPVQSAYVISGTAVNFTVTVKDNDNTACAPATFNLNDSIPSGWTGVWSTSGLSLSPGGSASATLTVTSPTGTPDGFYNVGLSATNAPAQSYTASTTATYVVSTPAPVSIAVATNQPSYSAGQTVTVTVTVLSGTAPASGASVNVAVTPPSGKPTTLSGSTGTSGTVSFTYKLSKRAALGTYGVQASLSSTGASATTGASTTFVVQ